MRLVELPYRTCRTLLGISLGVAVIAGCGEVATKGAETNSTTVSAQGSPPTTDAEWRRKEVTGYHLVGRPVVGIERTSGGDSFLVILRMNRRLPVNRFDRGADANFIVDSAGLDATPENYNRPRRNCYRGFAGNDNGRSGYVDGEVVAFEVAIAGRIDTLRGTVRLLEGGAQSRAALRDLGCR